jgi:hypothetical protein
MKMRVFWSATLLAAAYAGNAGAEIYRCVAGSSVSYQEFPCPAEAGAATMAIGDNFPAVNMLERDRLLAREAAMDARLLKRLEIDASERIARDDRIARALTLKAQMERERAEATSYYVVARPFAGRRAVPRNPWPAAVR